MHFMARLRIQPRMISVLVLTVTVLACVAGVARPAMAGSMGQDCFGPACEDQIGCGQPAQPQASSGFSVLLVAVRAVVERGVVLEKMETRSLGPPPLNAAWPSFAPLAPRSPPAA